MNAGGETICVILHQTHFLSTQSQKERQEREGEAERSDRMKDENTTAPLDCLSAPGALRRSAESAELQRGFMHYK